ncbi:MAG: 3-isopropylmalate dehydratase small subunit [Verrucomicrobiales bacterium]|jgi:3-isopropylmalate/(R)-2-methylmalate dehydratase small subunit|nr:3-isopropylmalate dehydratase small subunit [Verrucomicrobiales bacterium]
MALAKIVSISGRAVPVRGDDIDTDRIIPARFMKCVTFDGLGEFMFYDVRFDEQGNRKAHPLNEARYQGARVIVSGNNFGCGSSREHAPQAIYRHGVRAIIAEGFAEIFFGNSTTLGLPCVTVSRADREALQQLVEGDAEVEVTIDLERKTVSASGKVFPCDIRESARQALVSGHWDPIAELLESGAEVDAVAGKVGYMGR